jgi:MFS family permease
MNSTLCTIDLLSFIDRVNIGNARVAGLQSDLKMTDYQYSLALTVTYIPYIAIEIPAGLVLKRIGADTLMPTLVTLWGLITTLQGLITSFSGLLAARFFLGLVEGALVPGIMLVMSRFYKRDQIQLRLALFFTSASLTGAFSGLLASAILGMDGVAGHRGWKWIFILVRHPCIPP